MGVLGVTSADRVLVQSCLDKTRRGQPCTEEEHAAMERFHFGYYVFPRIQEMIRQSRLGVLPPIIWPPSPGPDPRLDPTPTPITPNPWWERVILNQELAFADRLAPLFSGDPGPQPSISFLQRRVEVLKRTRQALQSLVNDIDEELEGLERHGQEKSGS